MKHRSGAALLLGLVLALAACRAPDGGAGSEVPLPTDVPPDAAASPEGSATPVPNPDNYGY